LKAIGLPANYRSYPFILDIKPITKHSDVMLSTTRRIMTVTTTQQTNTQEGGAQPPSTPEQLPRQSEQTTVGDGDVGSLQPIAMAGTAS
jgi:hypothetical protein